MAKNSKNIVIGLCQIKISPGNIRENSLAIIKSIKQFRHQNVDMLIFPELATTGYLLGDIWERPSFLKENEEWLQKIIRESSDTLVVLGSVITHWDKKGEDGRPRKYNSIVLAQNGKALINPALGEPHFPKTLLPNYREFEETRHFFDLRKLSYERDIPLDNLLLPIPVKTPNTSFQLGVTICEDGWGDDYGIHPFKVLAKNGADILINSSCSPYTQSKNEKRNRVFSKQAKQLQKPLIYVNPIGLQNNGKTIFTFDGRSTVYSSQGKITFEAEPYKSQNTLLKIPLQGSSKQISKKRRPHKYAEIYTALRFGAEHYLEQCKLKKVVIGISGGIDSALAAALYGSFLPPENILLVNMPTIYNSNRTRTLAKRLAQNLSCYYAEVPIQDDVFALKNKLDTLKAYRKSGSKALSFNLTDLNVQNIQSRERGSRILAALASAFEGVFTCNANKAELTIGYSTLYGDMGGFMALLGDLWKEEVYQLSRYMNKNIYKRSVIPKGILTLPPSAELSDTQDITKGQGDPFHYPYHDKLFYSWVQKWNRWTPEDVLQAYAKGTLASDLGCKDVNLKSLFKGPQAFIQDLQRWWSLYNGLAVAKRVQAPPVLALSSRAFGFDHREPLGEAYYTEKYRSLKEKLLKKGTSKRAKKNK